MNRKGFNDLTGQRFTKLTALSYERDKWRSTVWNCICDCGKETKVNQNLLRNGKVRSCGGAGCIDTPIRNDLTGKTFGRLTVDSLHSQGKGVFYNCTCSCGNKTVVMYNSLVRGLTVSCGCFAKECLGRGYSRRLPDGVAAKKGLLNSYIRGANKRNLVFDLTESEFFTLVNDDCFYCNAKPSNVKKSGGGNFTYNGIDRLDPNLGYVTGNVIPCCRRCNFAKGTMTKDEFLNMVREVYQNVFHVALAR